MNDDDVEVAVGRLLLPSAPPELIDAVRRHLEQHGDADAIGQAPSSNGADGHRPGPTPERNPWRLLHVARGAPQEIVDIAYEFWRGGRTADAAAASVRARIPLAADANNRTLHSSVEESPLPSTNGANNPPACIETASGEHRFGIADQPLRIGVAADCDVVLPEQGPLEARIWPHGDRYLLRAVSGPVRIDGERVTLVVLDDGDILEIGNATFRFRLNTSD